MNLHNGGTVPVTVNFTVTITQETQPGAGGFSFGGLTPPDCQFGQGSNPHTAHCVRTLAPGDTSFLFTAAASGTAGQFGTASIDSATVPDPDTSNNSLNWIVSGNQYVPAS
jgi:hypothetical protein